MLRESVRGLMDEASDSETVSDIRRIIAENVATAEYLRSQPQRHPHLFDEPYFISDMMR